MERHKSVCHHCERPWKSADPNCHAFCVDYIIEDAFYQADKEEYMAKRNTNINLNEQTARAVSRANKGKRSRYKGDKNG